jgi:hypothetical protein
MFPGAMRLNGIAKAAAALIQGNTTTLLHFDNSSADSSGYNVTWTKSASGAYSATNKFGGNSFNTGGTGWFVATATTNSYEWGTGDFTLEFFWQISNTASSGFIWDNRPYTNGSAGQKRGIVVWWQSGTGITFGWQGGGTGYTQSITSGTAGFSSNTWYHIAIVRSSGVTKMYRDGTQVGSSFTDANNYGYQLLNTAGHSAIIGCPIDNESNADVGLVDEFRVSKIARYTTTFTAPTQAFTND